VWEQLSPGSSLTGAQAIAAESVHALKYLPRDNRPCDELFVALCPPDEDLA